MKVVYYLDTVEFGGAEKYIYLLAADFVKRGMQATVLMPETGPLAVFKANLEKAGVKVKYFCQGHKEVSGNETILDKLKSFCSGVILNIKGLYSLFKCFLAEKPDILHLNLHFPFAVGLSFPALIMKLFWKIKIVSTEHYPVEKPRARLVFFRLMAKKIFSIFIDKIITVSEISKECLLKYYKMNAGKIAVIYNGVDIDEFTTRNISSQIKIQIGLKEDNILIGVIGVLVERKGQEWFLKSIPGVIERHPALKVILVGEGSYKQKLQSTVNELHLNDRVLFLGFRNDIENIIQALDLIVVPSLHDPFPLVALEAMACGKPVIASAVDGLKEIITDGQEGFLVPPLEPEVLSEKINYILEQDSKKYGDKGRRKVVEKFSLRQMADKTLKLYQDLLTN